MRGKPLDVEMRAEIVRLYSAVGMPMREIAAQLSLSLSTVHRWVHRSGVAIHPPDINYRSTRELPQAEMRRTVELYRAGLTTAQIGELLNRTKGAIGNRLRMAGEPMRRGQRKPPEQDRLPRLPVGPFRDWCERYQREHGLELGGLADRLGVSPRVLFRALNENKMLTLEWLDRALLHEGNTLLWEVYPHLEPPRAPVASSAWSAR